MAIIIRHEECLREVHAGKALDINIFIPVNFWSADRHRICRIFTVHTRSAIASISVREGCALGIKTASDGVFVAIYLHRTLFFTIFPIK